MLEPTSFADISSRSAKGRKVENLQSQHSCVYEPQRAVFIFNARRSLFRSLVTAGMRGACNKSRDANIGPCKIGQHLEIPPGSLTSKKTLT